MFTFRGFGKATMVFGLGVFGLGGCGITVQRDLSATKPGEVVFDDMCGLQTYFDDLHDTTIAPPREVYGSDISGTGADKISGGKSRYRFETEFQLHHLRKVLTENWGKLPEEVAKAPAIDLEVEWSEKASVKRVLTTQPAILGVGDKNYDLPYHVCLSDLLYGDSLYRTRRTVLGLPPAPKSPFSKKAAIAEKPATDKPAAVSTEAAVAAAMSATATASNAPAESAAPAPGAAPGTTPAP